MRTMAAVTAAATAVVMTARVRAATEVGAVSMMVAARGSCGWTYKAERLSHLHKGGSWDKLPTRAAYAAGGIILTWRRL